MRSFRGDLRGRPLAGLGAVPARILSALLAAMVWGCSGEPSAEWVPPAVEVAGFGTRARVIIEERLGAVKSRPEDATTLGLAAMALHAYGIREPAMRLYRRASDIGSSDFRWHYLRGLLAADLGMPAEAVEAVRAAAMLATEELFVKMRLATVLLDADRSLEALELYDQIRPAQRDTMAVHFGRGICLARLERPAEALAELERAASYAGDYRPLYYQLALALRRVGRDEESSRFLALYERMAPDPRPPFRDPLLGELEELREGSYLHHLNRGMRQESAGRIEEAEREYLRALEAGPAQIHARVNLIGVYGKMGRYADAAATYRQALELNAESEEAHYNYGVILSRRGEHREAETAYRKALAVNPYSADARVNLGDTLERQDRPELAAEEFRRVLEVQSGHRLANFRLGMLLHRQGVKAEALGHLRRTVAIRDRETPQFLVVLARAERDMGMSADAARHAAEARRLAGQYDRPEILALLDREFPLQ